MITKKSDVTVLKVTTWPDGEAPPTQQNEPPSPRAAHMHRDPKSKPLNPEDDIEHFLTTFERMAAVCRWPKEELAFHFVPLLTGKARSAYVLMDITYSLDQGSATFLILSAI